MNFCLGCLEEKEKLASTFLCETCVNRSTLHPHHPTQESQIVRILESAGIAVRITKATAEAAQ